MVVQRFLVAAAALGLALVGAPESPSAAPTISIKARTAIQLDPIRRSYDGITIAGQIADRFSGEAVPWVYIRVQLDQTERLVTADKDGKFRVSLQVAEGSHQLTVEFSGDDRYARSSFHANNFDVSKEPLSLSVSVDPRVQSTAKTAKVTLKARVDKDGVALQVTLRVSADGGASKAAPALTQTVQTDGTGRAEVDIPRASLGAPGRKRVEVSFAGDDTYDPASDSATFLLVTASALAFELDDQSVSHSSRIKGTGSLRNADGAPIAGAPVAMLVGANRVAETITKRDGTFKLSVSASEVGPGKFNVQAVFDSAQSWRTSSRSKPVAITIDEPKPVPIGYTLAAFGATAFALLAFVALRTQPWKHWQRKRTTGDSADDDGDAAEDLPVHTGLAQARPSLVSTLRRANDHGFAGTVSNAIRHRGIPDAVVTATFADQERSTTTNASGAFALEDLEPGGWHIVVTCAGYVAESFDIGVPHRGELRGARVDLMPLRERIFDIYREVAEPLLPRRDLWGIWTPRQIFEHVRGAQNTRALHILTDYVEDAYFSQRIPGDGALSDTRRMVDAALAGAPRPRS